MSSSPHDKKLTVASVKRSIEYYHSGKVDLLIAEEMEDYHIVHISLGVHTASDEYQMRSIL